MANAIKPAKSPDQQISGLRKYNVVAGSLHLIQAVGFALVDRKSTRLNSSH